MTNETMAIEDAFAKSVDDVAAFASAIIPPAFRNGRRDRTGKRVDVRSRDYDAELARRRALFLVSPTRKNRRRMAIAERRANVRVR